MITDPDPQEPAAIWNDRIRERWNERAGWWDDMSEENARASARAHDLDRTARALDLRPGTRLLDAGCGTGQYAIAFAKRGYVVSGVDIAPAMIERARRHAADAGVAIDFRTGDYTTLIASDEPYDAIHARVSLQFVASAHNTLLAFARALKPEGRLYVSVPGAASPIYSTAWRRFLPGETPTITYITPWDLERLLTDLGWTILDQWGDLDPAKQAHIASALTEEHERLRILQTLSMTWAIIAAR
jgi:2-polyprenyl-3-methyl-5-hydroxy-6-metoxy-1,4-benzoquinol methylase